jgi:type I restriction enzyme R subunit
VEFKQIMGRGTRLFTDKYYFTVYDFVGASKNFQDAEWDGDPFCPVCGNYPCSCDKPKHYPEGEESGGSEAHEDGDGWEPPQPCPVCGHLPCTCPGGRQKKTVKVKLSSLCELTLHTDWDERIQFGDELINIEEYIKKLFGALPHFLAGEDDLRKRWSQPDTREQLLEVLAQSGFSEDKLEMTRNFLEMENCDMLDVLSFLAYNTKPIDRQRRAAVLRERALKQCTAAQLDFLNYIMDLYVRNGFKELGSDNLPTLIDMKYHSATDAVSQLNMQPEQIRGFYLGLQEMLYNGSGIVMA